MIATGLFAFVLGALAILAGAACVAARVFVAPRPLTDRAVAALVLALAACVAIVRGLSPLHLLVAPAVIGVTVVVGVVAVWRSGLEARRQVAADLTRARVIVLGALSGGPWSGAAWVGLSALGAAALAAWMFSAWAWDALGYHLPIVLDAVRAHTMRWVPTHIPYVNVYPRAVECFFVWCRLHLLDDALLDLGQVPFAITAAVVVAAMARRAGASAPRAAAWGAVFLAVPLVALQMATSYVDIAYAALLLASAYFATGRLAAPDAWLWALSAGFLLASKPCAPPAVAILSLVVLVRSVRDGHGVRGLLAVTLAMVLGGERYLANLVTHGNPIWPVGMRLGPLTLPGWDNADTLYMQGVPEPYAHYGWARRVLASLFTEPGLYIYDARLGGFGPLFTCVLVPLVLVGALGGRRRHVLFPALLVAACTLATPAAHCLRYALALPAALLAFAVVTSDGWKDGPRGAADLAVAAMAALGLWRALPGYTGGGPSLRSALAMTPEARASVASVDGHERQWIDARARIGPLEAAAYDRAFALPGLLFRHDGQGRVVSLAERDVTATSARIDDERVRILVAGDGEPSSEVVSRFREHFQLLFRCPLDPCSVYEVLRDPAGRGHP